MSRLTIETLFHREQSLPRQLPDRPQEATPPAKRMGVGAIAALSQWPRREKDPMPAFGIPSFLDDDVGVVFEEGEALLPGKYCRLKVSTRKGPPE